MKNLGSGRSVAFLDTQLWLTQNVLNSCLKGVTVSLLQKTHLAINVIVLSMSVLFVAAAVEGAQNNGSAVSPEATAAFEILKNNCETNHQSIRKQTT